MFLQTMDMFKVFFAILCPYNTLLNVWLGLGTKATWLGSGRDRVLVANLVLSRQT